MIPLIVTLIEVTLSSPNSDPLQYFAFVYVEKYAPSKQQLRTYLLKKYLKSGAANISKKNITDLIDIVLEDLEKSKFINLI